MTEQEQEATPGDVTLKAIHDAIVDSNIEQLQALCSSGYDLNQKFDENIDPQHGGITPLALACALNKAAIVQLLLESGADVNEPFAALKTTALMTSAYHGHEQVVRLLLQFGANVRAIDLQHSTALGYTFGGSRNIEVVRMLLNSKVDVNQRNMLGMNALLLVAGYGNEDMVGLILGAGADPGSVNDFGHTALHLAVVGKRDIINKLRLQKEVGEPDNSLNRRDLDSAIMEFARQHRDMVGQASDVELVRAANIMMNIGSHMEEIPQQQQMGTQDDQDGLERRVRALKKYREVKLQGSRQKRRSGLWTLLCGSGKSQKADDLGTNRPYVNSPQRQPTNQNDTSTDLKKEEAHFSEKFARIIQMLIKAGCDLHRMDAAYGMTALDLAILVGDVESTAVLVAADADPAHFLKTLSLKQFYASMLNDQGRVARDLLSYDEDLDVNQALSRFVVEHNAKDDGLMPLALAVRLDDLEVARLIIKKGADINQGGPSGRPPLCEASTKDTKKMAELLLSHNADLERTSPAYGDATPLTIAVISQRHQTVNLYIKKGAKVDRPMRDGRIPLFKALEPSDLEMIELLLNADLKRNFLDKNGIHANLAAEFQSPNRDPNAILQKAAQASRQFEPVQQQQQQQQPPPQQQRQDIQQPEQVQQHQASPPRADQQVIVTRAPEGQEQISPDAQYSQAVVIQEPIPQPVMTHEAPPVVPQRQAPAPPVEAPPVAVARPVIVETQPTIITTTEAKAEPEESSEEEESGSGSEYSDEESESEDEEEEEGEEEKGQAPAPQVVQQPVVQLPVLQQPVLQQPVLQQPAVNATATVVTQQIVQTQVVQQQQQAPVAYMDDEEDESSGSEDEDDDEEEETESEESSEEEEEEEQTQHQVNGNALVTQLKETKLDEVDNIKEEAAPPITFSGETTL